MTLQGIDPSTHQTTTSTNDYNLLSVGCNDSLNSSIVALGTNAQCYCKPPMQWHSNLLACVYVNETSHNATANASNAEDKCKVPRPEYGNPIAPLLGAKIQREDLGVLIGKQQLAAVYDTRANMPYTLPPSKINGVASFAAAPPLALGASWTTSLHKALYIQRSDNWRNTGFTVQAFRGDGTFISFSHPTATTYVPVNPVTKEQLVPILDGSGNQTTQVRLIDVDGNVELYEMYSLTTSTTGTLLSVSYGNGGWVNYSYSTASTLSNVAPYPGLLLKVTDDQGRWVKFRYEPSPVYFAGRIRSVESADGNVISFAYNAANQLSQINWPDGKVRTYLYERADLPWAMTGVIDENDSRFSTYTYDELGRAIATEYSGGVNRYAVSYGTPPSQSVNESLVGNVLTRDHRWVTPQDVSLQLPSGPSIALSAVDSNGTPLLSGQTQPAGSGCGASSNAVTYDANGNVLSKDDFQGQRICYGYDSSTRETTRVEGLATTVSCASVTPVGATLPAGARKITTTWHPDWRLPVQVSRPLRRSTTVYHGQNDPFNSNAPANCTTAAAMPNGKPVPLVCKQVEQATLSDGSLDSAVAAQVARYTYDAGGRVLTSTDANNRTTTYAYFADSAFFGSSYDPSIDAVALIVQGSSPGGSNTIADQSPTAKTLTAHGDAQMSTTQTYLGDSSLKLDGNGDYVDTTANLADFAFGTGDFTIEFFAWKSANGLNGYDDVLSTYTDQYCTGYFVELSSSRGLAFGGGSGAGCTLYAQYNNNPNDSAWHHWAITRSGTSLKLFKDGVVVATATNSISLQAPGFKIGADFYNEHFNGYLQLRITKGVARYTANFTPPGLEFARTDRPSSSSGHSPGDLQSVTNAAGLLTQFTQYEATGRLLQATDPKGVVTDIAYTPRGWISSVTTTPPGMSARTTSYTYDGAGQLTQISHSDGTTLSYAYDAAHRLIEVSDSRGSIATYTLDAPGNRVGEDLRDAGGVLRRYVSRSYDALNRLEQETVVGLTGQRTGTTTSLLAPSQAAPLTPVTLTAQVSGNAPSGTVDFYQDLALLGSATVSAGSASITHTYTSPADVRLKAIYAGDAQNSSRESPIAIMALRTPTNITVTASPNPAPGAATLVANVTGSSPRTGTVTFYDGGAAVATATVSASGNASVTYTWTLTTKSDKTFTASYSGDGSNAASTSAPYSLPTGYTTSTTTADCPRPDGWDLWAPGDLSLPRRTSITCHVTVSASPDVQTEVTTPGKIQLAAPGVVYATGALQFDSVQGVYKWDPVLTFDTAVMYGYGMSAKYLGGAQTFSSESPGATTINVLPAMPTTTFILSCTESARTFVTCSFQVNAPLANSDLVGAPVYLYEYIGTNKQPVGSGTIWSMGPDNNGTVFYTGMVTSYQLVPGQHTMRVEFAGAGASAMASASGSVLVTTH
jgi:YD repeat-containing protein